MERFGGSWNPFFIEKTTFLRGERNFRETFEKEREFQDRERKRVIPFAIFYEFKFAVSQDSSCVPSLSRLLLLLRKDGNATMQSKGDVSDTWCTKIVRGIRFPFARGGTPRISPFSKIVPGNVYRTGRAVSALNPLLSFKRIYTDFLISFPVYNLPIFHHFYLSPFLFHCFHSVHAIMEVSVWMKVKYLLFLQIFISFSCI